jgi:hypothetical protein
VVIFWDFRQKIFFKNIYFPHFLSPSTGIWTLPLRIMGRMFYHCAVTLLKWTTYKVGKGGGSWRRKHFGFSSFYRLLFCFLNKKSMFAVLHSDINSFKSGLLHLTGQPYCKKCIIAKVKDGIINLILWNYIIDQYSSYQWWGK